MRRVNCQFHTGLIFIFCPNHIFVIGKARHFKFCVLIDTEEYECMRDILLYLFSELRDLFKFWETSGNILLMVQNRDIVAMED